MLLTGMGGISPSSLAATFDCDEAYFAPDDFNHERPLLHPHQELVKSFQLAKAGNAMEQRNVAVSYDAGYLVTACPEKAHYWYQKAAGNRDQIAQNWLARYNKFKDIFDGPEFAIVNHNNPPQALASTPAPAEEKTAATSQQSGLPSADRLLAEISRQSNSMSVEGKITEIMQFMGDLIKAPTTPTAAHQESAR